MPNLHGVALENTVTDIFKYAYHVNTETEDRNRVNFVCIMQASDKKECPFQYVYNEKTFLQNLSAMLCIAISMFIENWSARLV
jgi:hypothetical protein